jgi:hypothetical protein
MRHVYTSPPPHDWRRSLFAAGPICSPARNLSRVPMPSRGWNLVAVPITVPLHRCRQHMVRSRGPHLQLTMIPGYSRHNILWHNIQSKAFMLNFFRLNSSDGRLN